MTTTTTAPRSVSLPSAAVLVGGSFAVCVLGQLAYFAGKILFTDVDAHADDGPIESIIGVGSAGTVALVLAIGVSVALRGTPERNRAGTIFLVILALASVIAFWSGATAVLGAAAAAKGGLARGAEQSGAVSRGAGLFGLFLAMADVVLIVVGHSV